MLLMEEVVPVIFWTQPLTKRSLRSPSPFHCKAQRCFQSVIMFCLMPRKALRDGFLKKALLQLQRPPSGQFEERLSQLIESNHQMAWP